MHNLTTTTRLKELLPQLFGEQKLKGDYYLRFRLTEQIAGLIDLKYVRESLTIQGDRITAVPNLSEYVIGLMSSRNQVFLALDLAHLAGLPPETVNLRQYQTIVLRTNSSDKFDRLVSNKDDNIDLFGLTVRKIEGINRILSDRFIPVPENLPQNLRPFVTSAVPLTSEKSISTEAEKCSLLIDIERLIFNKISSPV